MVTVNDKLSLAGYASGNRLPDCSKLAINQKKDIDVTTCRNYVIVKLLTLFVSFLNFSYWAKFHLNTITGSGVMTVYFHKRHWPEIRKSETPTSELSLIFEDSRELGMPNLSQMCLIKFY